MKEAVREWLLSIWDRLSSLSSLVGCNTSGRCGIREGLAVSIPLFCRLAKNPLHYAHHQGSTHRLW